MKRNFTKLTAVFALLALFALPLTGWAQTTINWDATEQGYTNQQEITSVTFDNNVSASFNKGTNNNAPKYYTNGTAIRCYGGNYFTVSTTLGNLTDIAITFGNNDGTNAISTDVGTYSNGTWSGSASSVTFTIGGTTGNRRIAGFTITYATGGNPNAATPTFSPAGGTYSQAQSVTISCATQGATIYYTTNGEDPTTSSSVYSTALSISETTTVKAMATATGYSNSGIATATYTIEQPMTIAEIRAQGTGNVFTQGIVTSCVGTTGYIQDATAAICVYGTSLTVGDEIIVSGSLSTYNGLLEIVSPVVSVVSSNNTVNPTVKTIAEINEDYAANNALQGWLVRIESATVTAISGQNTTIAQGNNAIVVRGISSDVTYAVNDILTLDGNIGCFNAAQIANPQNVTVQQNNTPFINIQNATVSAPCEASQGTIAVTYTHFTDIEPYIEFFAADGETSATYNWITVTFDAENNAVYNIAANNGAARTAYFKVFEANEGTYSNLVTVNQAKYVAEYATLPFEFDGGIADIEDTPGLTGYNLGSDYSASPKLKFNNANETISSLILRFNEVPGTLTFDIKGNPSNGVWAGTFKVQTSEDGETYTDLATYTSLTTTVQSESFENLGENVRYIKWIYTEKTSGNVALGNIVLYEEGGGPVTPSYDLTVQPIDNLEIFTFVGGDETQPALEGAGTIQVTEGDQVMLSVTANEGYILQSLTVDGVEHVNDIEDAMYTFTMPGHNVTISATAAEDVPPTPFEPVTYTLATTIESGKTYIIVGKKTIEDEDYYYAMGGQTANNRSGVAISVDGTTATVETAEVHEFVITALEEESFYSIYDDGYLYAAGSNKNYLRTMDTLNENGKWEISIDTLFHIVASQSSNRNVMQFNYNGGNTLFNCYSSASQLPVYLYVKDETPTTMTQTIALASGANYVSFYVDVTLDNLKAALVEALPAGNNTTITIKSRTQNVKYQRGRWSGQLTTLNMANMYTVIVSEACEIVFEGTPIDPSTLSVDMISGANWIAFPFTESMSVANFFAGFAQDQDQVKSRTTNSKYQRGRWGGALTTLEPGQGYIYVTSTPRTFTFPTNTK